MKSFFRIHPSPLLLFFLFIAIFSSCTKRVPVHESWDKKTWRKANTAKFAFYLSRRSKESIRTMNLVRMNGPLFAKTYYTDYLIKGGIMKDKDDSVGLSKKRFHRTLYYDLMNLKPMPLLRPSFSLHLSSSFHALTSGIGGYEGHDRPLPFMVRLRLFGNFANYLGENCTYGKYSGFEAILDLLIDEGIEGYAHRKNIFNKRFIRVGCSFKFHTQYQRNYVQDFSNGNLFQRMF